MRVFILRIIIPAFVILNATQTSGLASPLSGEVRSSHNQVKTSERKNLVGAPDLISIRMPGQGTQYHYYLVRIPLFVPHAKKAKSLKVRAFLTTAAMPDLAMNWPDYLAINDSSYDSLQRHLSDSPSPSIISIYPVHQYLETQFVHSGSISGTLQPSWSGASAGSATVSSSKQVGYSAELPRCIGTFDDLLHAVAWDYYQAKDQPVNLGLVNQYALIRYQRDDHFDEGKELYLTPIVILNNDTKRPYFAAPLQMNTSAAIPMDQYVKEHAGELSSEERDFLDTMNGTEKAEPDHYDLILQKKS